jgi:hypothetical protein
MRALLVVALVGCGSAQPSFDAGSDAGADAGEVDAGRRDCRPDAGNRYIEFNWTIYMGLATDMCGFSDCSVNRNFARDRVCAITDDYADAGCSMADDGGTIVIDCRPLCGRIAFPQCCRTSPIGVGGGCATWDPP